MDKPTIAAVAAIGALILTTAAAPQKRNVLEQRVDAVVDPYFRSGMFNGLVMIADGDKVVLTKSYGLANYELRVPFRNDTKFQIGSISKRITDAGLAILLDQGKLSFETKVSDFLPDFPRGSEITIGLILEQKSGIPHTNLLADYDRITRMTLWDSIAILKTKPLDYQPGTSSAYSNGAYDVLAAMIEKASGQPFQQWIQTKVLDPLGMKDTGFVHAYEIIPGMADPYTPGRDPSSRARAAFYGVEKRPGGGAMYSTAGDLLKFLRASYGGRITGPKNTADLFGEPGKQYQPIGRNPGYSTVLFTDTAKGLYIITLANNGASLDNFGRQIYQAVIGDPWETEQINPAKRKVGSAEAAYFDGFYKWEGRSSKPFHLLVEPDGDLVVKNSEPDADYVAAMTPLADGRWLQPIVDGICKPEGAERAEAFNCVSRIKRNQGKPFRMVRIPSPNS